MTFLFDVNVLIALIDRSHIHHEVAEGWFNAEGNQNWATCPITQNGVVRIVGSPRYVNFPGSAATITEMMRRFVTLPGHVFWPDDISLLDPAKVDPSRLLSSAQVTDSYLLALARAHGGKLATLDRRLIVDAVVGGVENLYVIR